MKKQILNAYKIPPLKNIRSRDQIILSYPNV